MAIYHLQVKTVSRREGRSAVAAAAYRSGERLRDERLGIEHDYTRKQGVIETDIIAPAGVPDWVYERDRLWNAAEAAESRKDAKVAREYEIALPFELTPEQRRELVLDYAGWLAERHRIVVDVAIHAPHRDGDRRNHHAHLLTTTREVTCEGLGGKTRALDVARTSSALIEEARAVWADYCNDRLRRAQVLDREVDHRSYERQGLDQTPTMHLGPEATAMERRGEVSRIGEQNRLIHALNQARALASEQLERAREVLERLVERVKELGHDVSEGLSEGLRRFQEALSRDGAREHQLPAPERALEGSQGAPGRYLRTSHLERLTQRFEEARDRFHDLRAERDRAEGQERAYGQMRVDAQRPALHRTFGDVAKANPLKAMDLALGEVIKFNGRDDNDDLHWWADLVMQLQQVPEGYDDIMRTAETYYAKARENELKLAREQDRERAQQEKSIQQSIDRGRGMGLDMDFD